MLDEAFILTQVINGVFRITVWLIHMFNRGAMAQTIGTFELTSS